MRHWGGFWKPFGETHMLSINKIISSALISSFILNSSLVFAKTSTTSADGSIYEDQLTKILKFDVPDAQTKHGYNLVQLQKVAHYLQERRINDFPVTRKKNFLDPNNLANQQLLIYRDGDLAQTIDLNSPMKSLTAVAFDDIKTVSVDGNLEFHAISRGEVVAKHIIPSLSFVAEASDEEFKIVINKKGEMYALDMGVMIHQIFKGVIPSFKVYDAENAPVSLSQLENPEITFLTRGLKPFSLQEIGVKDEYKVNRQLIPTDDKGKAYLTTGDIVVYERLGGKRNLKGIFNRNVIREIVSAGLLQLTYSAMLASAEGHGRTFGEKVNHILHEKNNDKSPFERLVESLKSIEGIKKVQPVQDLKNTEIDQMEQILIAKALSGFNREQIRKLLDLGLKKSTTESEKLDAESWFQSYQKILQAAPDQLNDLKNAILNDPKSIFIEDWKNEQATLEKESQKGDFRNMAQILLKKSFNREHFNAIYFPEKLRFYEKIRYKDIGILSAKIAAYTAVGYAGFKGVEHTLPEVAVQFHAMINYVYGMTIFPDLFKAAHSWYQKPLIFGTSVQIFAILPLIVLYGHMADYLFLGISKTLSKMDNLTNNQIKLLGRLSHRAHKAALLYKDLDWKQRIITISAQPCAMLMNMFYNYIFAALNQPTMFVLANGISPLTYVSHNNSLGKRLNMTPEDKSYFVGFNKITYNKEKIDEIRSKQQNALDLIAKDKSKTKELAIRLATLVVASEENLDISTLRLAVDNPEALKDLPNIQSNKTLQKKWEIISQTTLVELMSLQSREKININDLSSEDLMKAIQLTKKIAKIIKSDKKLSLILLKLKVQSKTIMLNVFSSFAKFGQEEYQKLRTMIASKFIASQTWSEFWIDQLFVVVLYAIIGERANLNDPANLAHVAVGGFLWSTRAHWIDIFYNIWGHLVYAGPKGMLMYQTVKAKTETNYIPLSTLLIESNARAEKFWPAAAKWLYAFKNVKEMNLGNYYAKFLKRQVTTFQAGLISAVLVRHFVGEMSWQHAFMGWAIFEVSKTLAYGWPWEFLRVGNQYEEDRIEEKSNALKKVQLDVYDAIKKNQGDDKIITALNDFSKLYANGDNDFASFVHDTFRKTKTVLNNIADGNFNDLADLLDIKLDDYTIANKIKFTMQNDEVKRTLLMGLILKQDQLNKEQNYIAMKDNFDKLKLVLSDDFKAGDLTLAEIEELQSLALRFANHSIAFTPISTKANQLLATMTTFVFGAALTTYLSTELAVSTSTIAHLNGDAFLNGLTYYLMFIGGTYLFLSEKGLTAFQKGGDYAIKSLEPLTISLLAGGKQALLSLDDDIVQLLKLTGEGNVQRYNDIKAFLKRVNDLNAKSVSKSITKMEQAKSKIVDNAKIVKNNIELKTALAKDQMASCSSSLSLILKR